MGRSILVPSIGQKARGPRPARSEVVQPNREALIKAADRHGETLRNARPPRGDGHGPNWHSGGLTGATGAGKLTGARKHLSGRVEVDRCGLR